MAGYELRIGGLRHLSSSLIGRVVVGKHRLLRRIVVDALIHNNRAKSFGSGDLLNLKLGGCPLVASLTKALNRRGVRRAHSSLLVVSKGISGRLGLASGAMPRSDAMLGLVLVLLDRGRDHDIALRLRQVLARHWLSASGLMLSSNSERRLTTATNNGSLHVSDAPRLGVARGPRVHLSNDPLLLDLANGRGGQHKLLACGCRGARNA